MKGNYSGQKAEALQRKGRGLGAATWQINPISGNEVLNTATVGHSFQTLLWYDQPDCQRTADASSHWNYLVLNNGWNVINCSRTVGRSNLESQQTMNNESYLWSRPFRARQQSASPSNNQLLICTIWQWCLLQYTLTSLDVGCSAFILAVLGEGAEMSCRIRWGFDLRSRQVLGTWWACFAPAGHY